jgi:5-methylcytosine-specific restriction endonuclease McrA
MRWSEEQYADLMKQRAVPAPVQEPVGIAGAADGRKCSMCGHLKALTDFYTCSKKRKDGTFSRSGHCKACHLIVTNQWRKDHPEAVKAINKRVRSKRRGAHLQYMKEYHARRGPEPYTPEIAKRRRLARQKNRDKYLEYRQRWISNPDNRRKYNVWQANRRARERSAPGSFSLEDWLVICAAAAWKCLRCGEERPLSIDHVVPLSMGGSNYPSNLQPLCQPCNAAKGNRHIDLRVMAG